MKNLGQTIKEKRKYKGLSREKLAEIADITPQYLTNVENLNRTPSFKVLRKIVRELDISLDDLIFPERSEAKSKKAEVIKKIELCSETNLPLIEALLDAVLSQQNNCKG